MKSLTILQVATPIQAAILFIIGIIVVFAKPEAMPELIEFAKMYLPLWIGQVIPALTATPIKTLVENKGVKNAESVE